MSTNLVIRPNEMVQGMVYGLVVTAMFVHMILKQKKAAKAKKPIPLTPRGIEITTYLFLALQCFGIFILIGAQLASAMRG